MPAKIYGLAEDYFLGQFGESQRHAVVSDEELSSPEFLIDALATVRAKVINKPHRKISGYYVGLYCDLDGYFPNGQGSEVFLDSDILIDMPDEWWRDTVQTLKPRTTALRLREENKERLRVIFSIHRAVFPEETVLWGIRPVNDNS